MKFALLLTLAILAGCSAPPESTRANFRVSLAALADTETAAQFPGGLILYGVSKDMSFGQIMTSDIRNEYVPNGVWSFYVIGWDGNASQDAMTGKVYCALKEGVELNGNSVEVELNATNVNCSKAVFGANSLRDGTVFHFPKIDVQTCNRLDHIAQASGKCEYFYDFSGETPVYTNTKGAARSFQILAASYKRIEGKTTADYDIVYKSKCSQVESDLTAGNGGLLTNAFESSNLNLPPGSLGSPFSFVLRAFYGTSNCDDVFGYKDILMKRGAAPKNLTVKTFFDEIDTNVIFAKTTASDVCSGKWNKTYAGAGAQPFKGGAGSAGAPFILCDGEDLNEINHNFANGSAMSHFLLGKNIDMDPLTASLGGDNVAPCLEGFENFVPIGGLVSGAGAEQDNLNCSIDEFNTFGGTAKTDSGAIDFSGTFDGGGKTIFHLRTMKSDASRLGFIRTLSGTFMNTRFVTPRVTGKDITGLVGQSWTSAVIYNIQVQDGRVVGSKDAIYGNAFVGGIAGHFEGNKILDVTVENTLVKAIDGDYVGGLIGMAQSGEFANLSFHGEVDAFDGLSGSDYAGGLAGYLGTGVSLHGGVAQGNLKADIGLNHGEDFGYSLDAATDDITTNMTINGL